MCKQLALKNIQDLQFFVCFKTPSRVMNAIIICTHIFLDDACVTHYQICRTYKVAIRMCKPYKPTGFFTIIYARKSRKKIIIKLFIDFSTYTIVEVN